MSNGRPAANGVGNLQAVGKPEWDSSRRELRMGDHVVKRFRQHARNQETILAAFQEEGWPSRIDDPLPRDGEHDVQERLHAAIKKLNKQAVHLLCFRADGTGEGVLWEPR
jgi:hypothetical protein